MIYARYRGSQALCTASILEDWTKTVVTDTSSAVGFAVIVVLYAVIGLLAAAGSVVISQKLFPGRSEQICYGVFLTAIAGFYLAFAAYFGNASSWSTELFAAACGLNHIFAAHKP